MTDLLMQREKRRNTQKIFQTSSFPHLIYSFFSRLFVCKSLDLEAFGVNIEIRKKEKKLFFRNDVGDDDVASVGFSAFFGK